MVCCAKGENSAVMSVAGLCPEELPLEMCDTVCCAVNGMNTTRDRRACVTDGGMVVDNAVCEQVCCQEGDSVSTRPADACGEAGGVPVDAPLCDTVCCNREGVQIRQSRFACGDGEIVADESCDSVCCLVGDEANESSPEECEGQIVPAVPWCVREVCCSQPNNRAARMSEAACAASGGDELADHACTIICCIDGNGNRENVSLHECDNREQWNPDRGCATVCCREADGSITPNVNRRNCWDEGQEVLEDRACNVVCCRTGDETNWTDPADCEGAVVEDNQCADPNHEMVCCRMDERTYVRRPRDGCINLGGIPEFADVLCEPTCCVETNTGAAEMTTIGFCGNDHNYAQRDDANCMDVCCVIENGVPESMPWATCSHLGGVEVGDPRCEDIGKSRDNGAAEAIPNKAPDAPQPPRASTGGCSAMSGDRPGGLPWFAFMLVAVMGLRRTVQKRR